MTATQWFLAGAFCVYAIVNALIQSGLNARITKMQRELERRWVL